MTAKVLYCRFCGKLIVDNAIVPCPWCRALTLEKENQQLMDRVLELELMGPPGHALGARVGRSYPRPGLHPRYRFFDGKPYRLIREEGANKVYESEIDPVGRGV